MAEQWSDARMAQLEGLWATDASAAAIGAQMGLSRGAVIGKAHRMGLPAHPDARKKKGPIPVRARRALVQIVAFHAKEGRLPTVSELAEVCDSNRGIASDSYRELERFGLVWRSRQGIRVRWDEDGHLTETAPDLARMYEGNPRKWLDGYSQPERQGFKGHTTRYRSKVTEPGDQPLKPGRHVEKVGSVVSKGFWKGAQIYVLTLEERRTCSTTCKMYEHCYGNNMPKAKRLKHGLDLTEAIEAQLKKMDQKGKRKRLVVIRLHILGDFYSPEYVKFWEFMLVMYDWLRIFGYTAWPAESDIGKEVLRVRAGPLGHRFMIRTSGYGYQLAAFVRKKNEPIPEGAFQCPEQTKKTKECGTCGACWSTLKNVVFIQH